MRWCDARRNLVAKFDGCIDESNMKPMSDPIQASSMGSYQNISMTGSEIFKFAVRAVPQVRALGNHAACRMSSVRYGPFFVTGISSALRIYCRDQEVDDGDDSVKPILLSFPQLEYIWIQVWCWSCFCARRL